MKNFYCVVRGFHQGIFENEEDAKKEVKNYYDGHYKGFDTKYEAEQFLKYYNENDCRKIYVVKRGYVPGIYFNREDVLPQIKDYPFALVRKYKLENINLAIKFLQTEDIQSTLSLEELQKRKEQKEKQIKINKLNKVERLKNQDIKFKRQYICFLDCEANQERVISLGCVIIDLNNLTIIDSFYTLSRYKSFEKMEPFCESLTKISTEDILSSTDFMTIWKNFLSWLQNYSCIEICTWSKADKKFLARTLKEYELQIPYKLEFKDIQPIISANVMGKQTLGLGKVKELYGYENIIQHNALEDAKDTFLVYKSWYERKMELV